MTMTAMWRCDHRLRLQSIRGSCSVGCCYLGLACVLATVAAPSRHRPQIMAASLPLGFE